MSLTVKIIIIVAIVIIVLILFGILIIFLLRKLIQHLLQKFFDAYALTIEDQQKIYEREYKIFLRHQDNDFSPFEQEVIRNICSKTVFSYNISFALLKTFGTK